MWLIDRAIVCPPVTNVSVHCFSVFCFFNQDIHCITFDCTTMHCCQATINIFSVIHNILFNAGFETQLLQCIYLGVFQELLIRICATELLAKHKFCIVNNILAWWVVVWSRGFQLDSLENMALKLWLIVNMSNKYILCCVPSDVYWCC